FAVGRQHENADRLGEFLFHLRGSLHINIEHKVMPLPFRFFEKPPRRAVVIYSVDTGMFKECVGANHLLKFLAGNEVVLLTVLLTAPRSTRGVGNGEI